MLGVLQHQLPFLVCLSVYCQTFTFAFSRRITSLLYFYVDTSENLSLE